MIQCDDQNFYFTKTRVNNVLSLEASTRPKLGEQICFHSTENFLVLMRNSKHQFNTITKCNKAHHRLLTKPMPAVARTLK